MGMTHQRASWSPARRRSSEDPLEKFMMARAVTSSKSQPYIRWEVLMSLNAHQTIVRTGKTDPVTANRQ